MKILKLHLPELYLIGAIIFYYISAASIVNWFAIALLAVLAILVLTKNKALGVAIGFFWILISLYLVLAIISELSEFTSFNKDAMQLAVIGFLFVALNIVFSSILIFKYAKPKSD